MKTFLKVLDDDTYQKVDVAYIDGYDVGDRILDGVMFEVRVINDKFVVKVSPSHEWYFQKLNAEYWYPRLVEYCHTLDLFYADPCGGDVVCWDSAKPYNEQVAYFDKDPVISC